MFERSDSQESKDMMKLAFKLSEDYNTTVMLRVTTRTCHSKSIVQCVEREEAPIKEYSKDLKRYPFPCNAGAMREKVEKINKAKRVF
jgi:indolepyruvate ferredoxin oxidoreductase, alpha subunit